MSDRVVGWILLDRSGKCAYRQRLYRSVEEATVALDGIVWHSRERYDICPVPVSALLGIPLPAGRPQ